jgi:hypothetical protein
MRLEEGVQECNTSLVEARSDIKYMRESMKESLNELASKVDLVLTSVADIKPRLEKVEETHRISSARYSWVRNTIVGLVIGGLGVVVSQLVSHYVK